MCSTKIKGNYWHIIRHAESSSHKQKISEAKNHLIIDKFLDNNETDHLTEDAKAGELVMTAFLAEHNLSFSVGDHLIKMIKNIAKDSKIVKKMEFNRKKATKYVTEIVASENIDNLREILNNSYFSLLIDECTDITVKSGLAIVVRVKYDDFIRDRFLGLIELHDGTAENIFTTIKHFFGENNISLKNLVGFSADNCSTMMGIKNGVQAKLKEECPNLFVQGCMCHILNLCAKKAANEIPKSILELISAIKFHFANSTSRREEFLKFQEYFGTPTHSILNASSTRWLSLEVMI